MATPQGSEVVRDMTLAELQAVEEACRDRMVELRQSGVQALADKFEEMATATLGMSAKELMSASRKVKRAKPARGRQARDDSHVAEQI